MTGSTTYDKIERDHSDETSDADVDAVALVENEVAEPVVIPVQSFEEKVSSKFPWRRLGSVYMVVVLDNISLTVITPFIADMCRFRFGIAEENVGLAAGLISGGYSLAVFASSFALGHFSDVYGRKKLLLLGSGSNAICGLLFGYAPAFWMALVLRILAGLCNASVAITKAIFSDITTGKQRVIAFAYHGAAFSISRAISSAMGGFFTGVTFGDSKIFSDPYIFPCVASSICSVVAFILTIFFVPETGKKENPAEKKSFSLLAGIREIGKDKLMMKLIVVYCINSFYNGALLLALALFYSLPVPDHGMGYSPQSNGIIFSVFGGLAVLFQMFLFRITLEKLKILKTYLLGTISLGFGGLLVPAGATLYWIFGESLSTDVLSWMINVVLMIPVSVGFMTCLPVLGTMQSNAADPARQGLIMGTAQSVSSLFRAIGPVLAGAIFSFSVTVGAPFILFILIAAGYFLCLWTLRTMTQVDIQRISGEILEVEMSGKEESIKSDQDVEDDDQDVGLITGTKDDRATLRLSNGIPNSP